MMKPPTHAFRLKMAKQKAEGFLRDEGITTVPVDPFAIAASRDIDVKAKPDTAEGTFRAKDSRGSASATSWAIIF
jgi:hypothetical protein